MTGSQPLLRSPGTKTSSPSVSAPLATVQGSCWWRKTALSPRPQSTTCSLRPRPRTRKICEVAALDETQAHSPFKPVNKANFSIPVATAGLHPVYSLKWPQAHEFLQPMREVWESTPFTASLAKCADSVADLLQAHAAFRAQLFRGWCVCPQDRSRLARDLRRVLIPDSSPAPYVFRADSAGPLVWQQE